MIGVEVQLIEVSLHAALKNEKTRVSFGANLSSPQYQRQERRSAASKMAIMDPRSLAPDQKTAALVDDFLAAQQEQPRRFSSR